jgi:CIC family chloride channel protein
VAEIVETPDSSAAQVEAARPEGATEQRTVGDLVTRPVVYLVPGDDLRAALASFSRAAQESLPVVDDPEQRHVIGYVSEAYALRRYAQELERRRSIDEQNAGIFCPETGDQPGGPATPKRGVRHFRMATLE